MWTVEEVQRAYDELRFTYEAKTEQMIHEMAVHAADANDGHPHLDTFIANGIYHFPVHARGGGYRDIDVRLLPDMEREEAIVIAERQIREQWRQG